jgi:hypothetical protein
VYSIFKTYNSNYITTAIVFVYRCKSNEAKYGPPVKCEICQQTCAFNRSDLRIEGKLHCWLCKSSYKRALAKVKKTDIDRHRDRDRAKKRSADEANLKTSSSMKMSNANSSSRNNNNNNNNNNAANSGRANLSDIPEKMSKTNNSVPVGHDISDHVVALTQLREQIATLQKKLQQKDNQLLQKDKEVSCFQFSNVSNCYVLIFFFISR